MSAWAAVLAHACMQARLHACAVSTRGASHPTLLLLSGRCARMRVHAHRGVRLRPLSMWRGTWRVLEQAHAVAPHQAANGLKTCVRCLFEAWAACCHPPSTISTHRLVEVLQREHTDVGVMEQLVVRPCRNQPHERQAASQQHPGPHGLVGINTDPSSHHWQNGDLYWWRLLRLYSGPRALQSNRMYTKMNLTTGRRSPFPLLHSLLRTTQINPTHNCKIGVGGPESRTFLNHSSLPAGLILPKETHAEGASPYLMPEGPTQAHRPHKLARPCARPSPDAAPTSVHPQRTQVSAPAWVSVRPTSALRNKAMVASQLLI